MNLADVQKLLGARVLIGKDHLDRSVRTVCGSDLMSDVLAFTAPGSLLLTGLTHPQVIRTAQILDLVGIVFVRGKEPAAETIEMAGQFGIPLLGTDLPMYETCGLLFAQGLPGCENPEHVPAGNCA